MDNMHGTNTGANIYNDVGNGNRAEHGPYVGIVMANIDANRTGRVSVWLKTRGNQNRNDESGWRDVRYLSPFYGNTSHDLNDTSDSDFNKNAHSYGMWFTTPDLGVEVLCFFVNGDPSQGYYVGCIPQPQMNHMIPAVGAKAADTVIFNTEKQRLAFNTDANTQLPTCEINRSDKNMNNPNFKNLPKPLHTLSATQMWQAGTISDTIRGPIGSSAQRESPSYAYGISTPGRERVKEGSNKAVKTRQGGHSFVMDDGDIKDNDRLIRLRTATGHQITMSDSGAALYIAHANGQTWLEFGNEGTVDVYSSNSINLRSQGEINIHADKDINMHSNKNINFYAKENIKQECEKRFDIIGKEHVALYSEKKLTVKSDGFIHCDSLLQTRIRATANVAIKGSRIDLNTYDPGKVKKTEYHEPSLLPETEFSDITGWRVSEAKINKTIVSRAPTHEPYPEHNTGVPEGIAFVPTLSPAVAKPQTQQVIDAVKATPPVTKVTVAKAATQAKNAPAKAVGPVSAAQTTAAVAARKEEVAVAASSGIIKGVGELGIPVANLEAAGTIVQGVVSKLTTITAQLSALADNSLFTGKGGINSLADLTSSLPAQTAIAQQAMEQAYTSFKQAGVLTGLESATDTMPMIAASFEAGASTISKWASGNTTSISNDVLAGINSTAGTASHAAELAVSKAGGVLNNITAGGVIDSLKQAGQGFAEQAAPIAASVTEQAAVASDAIASGVKRVVGTVDRSALDAIQNDLIGDKLMPDVTQLANTAKSLTGAVDIGALVKQAEGLGSKTQPLQAELASLAPGAFKNLAELASNVSNDLTSTVTGAIGVGTNTFNEDYF